MGMAGWKYKCLKLQKNIHLFILNSKFKFKFCIQILEGEKVGDGCDRLRRAADVEADTISQLCL